MGIVGFLLILIKIVLWVLAFILGLVVLVLAIVLFVPLVYRFNIEKYETIAGDGKVTWFFGHIKLLIYMENQEPKVKIIIFGYDLDDRAKNLPKSKNRKPKKKKKTGKEKQPIINVRLPEKKKEEKTVWEEIAEERSQERISTNVGRGKQKEPQFTRVKMNRVYVPPESTESPKKKEKGTQGKEEINLEYFKKMTAEEKSELIKICFTLIKRVFKEVLPNKTFVEAVIGTGDPASTGYVLAGAGVLKGTICPNVNVKGKFDETIFQGKGILDGKITVWNLCYAGFKFVREKPIWKIIKLYMKGNGE